MWDRGHILDREHVDAVGMQSADRGLAAGTDAADEDVDLLEAGVADAVDEILDDHARGVRGRLLGTLEADLAGARPAQDVAGRVGHGDDGVVVGGVDVGAAARDLAHRFAAAAPGLRLRGVSGLVLVGARLGGRRGGFRGLGIGFLDVFHRDW